MLDFLRYKQVSNSFIAYLLINIHNFDFIKLSISRESFCVVTERVYIKSNFTMPLIYFHVPSNRCRFPRSVFWSAKIDRQRSLGRVLYTSIRKLQRARKHFSKGWRRLNSCRKRHFTSARFSFTIRQNRSKNGVPYCFSQQIRLFSRFIALTSYL